MSSKNTKPNKPAAAPQPEVKSALAQVDDPADQSPIVTSTSASKEAWFATQDLVLRAEGQAIEIKSHTGQPLSEVAVAQIKEAKQFDSLVHSGVLVRQAPATINRNSSANRERINQKISDVRNAA